jgi:hypothetical protein
MSLASKITIVPVSEVPDLRHDFAGKGSGISVQSDLKQTAPSVATSATQPVSNPNGKLRIKAGAPKPAKKAKRSAPRKRRK